MTSFCGVYSNKVANVSNCMFEDFEYFIKYWLIEVYEMEKQFQNQAIAARQWDAELIDSHNTIIDLSNKYNDLMTKIFVMEQMMEENDKLLKNLEETTIQIENIPIIINDHTIDPWRFPLYNNMYNTIKEIALIGMYVKHFKFSGEYQQRCPIVSLMNIYCNLLTNVSDKISKCEDQSNKIEIQLDSYQSRLD